MKITKHILKLAKGDEYTARTLAELKHAMTHNRYYTRVNTVARSGMSRTIIIMYQYKGRMHNVYDPAILALAGVSPSGRISGCGMDMLFAAQYNLFQALHRSYSEADYTNRMSRYNLLR